MRLSSSLLKLLMFSLLCIPIIGELFTNSDRSLNTQREHDYNYDSISNTKMVEGNLWASKDPPPPSY